MRWMMLPLLVLLLAVLVVVSWYRTDVTRSDALVHVAVSMSQPAVDDTSGRDKRLVIEASGMKSFDEAQQPASLSDVQPRFAIQTDGQGNLLITLDILDLFEFYLSAKGEINEADVQRWIDHYLQQQLSEPALTQSRQLYLRYVDYLKAAAELPVYEWHGLSQEQMDWQAVRQQLADIEALRRYYFPTAYEVFFAADAEHTEQLLNQMQFGQTKLSNESYSEPYNEQQRLNVLLLQRYNAEHSTPIEAMVSADAQSRMTQRQAQRTQWQQRVEQFSRWHDALQQAGLDHDEYHTQRDQELAQRFTDSEQYRVKSLLSLW